MVKRVLVGTDRLLELFAKYNIKATWVISAHSIELFPKQMSKIKGTGHEIGLHGYTHELVSTLNASQERDVLVKSIEVLTSFTGKKPKGWTAPAWSFSNGSIKLLEESPHEYDYSFMHHDSQLYYIINCLETWHETDIKVLASSWMKPMSALTPSTIVEVPENWHLDDSPPLQPEGGDGFVDTRIIEQLWKDQFDYHYIGG